MRIIANILLIIFFFVFSFVNCGNTFIFLPEAELTIANVDNSYNIHTCGSESYIMVQANSCDEGVSPQAFGASVSESEKKFGFADYNFRQNINNTVSFLFRTEIFPNAP